MQLLFFPRSSVAERISELENQQKSVSCYDNAHKFRVPDPALKAIQKKALLSFYERRQNNSSPSNWRSEPQLVRTSPPQPPPRPHPKLKPLQSTQHQQSRRSSNSSELLNCYNQHSNSCASVLGTNNLFSNMWRPQKIYKGDGGQNFVFQPYTGWKAVYFPWFNVTMFSLSVRRVLRKQIEVLFSIFSKIFSKYFSKKIDPKQSRYSKI